MKATLLILSFIIYIVHIKTEFPERLTNYREKTDKNFTETLLLMSVDVVQDTTRRISLLQNMQKENSGCVAFELGYLTYIIQDKYRRMVDLYNASLEMDRRLYLLEYILYLQDIEHIYWEINHLTSMLHEIERKYGKEVRLDVVYDFVTTTTPFSVWTMGTTTKKRKTTGFVINKYLAQKKWSTTKKRKPKWWPLDYGWEINYYW